MTIIFDNICLNLIPNLHNVFFCSVFTPLSTATWHKHHLSCYIITLERLYAAICRKREATIWHVSSWKLFKEIFTHFLPVRLYKATQHNMHRDCKINYFGLAAPDHLGYFSYHLGGFPLNSN